MNRVRVFYDGRCTLCWNTVATLQRLDRRGVLEPISFRDPGVAERFGLDPVRAAARLHAWADGARAPADGIDAVMLITTRLPPLWPVVPLLWVAVRLGVGPRLYDWIAARRLLVPAGHGGRIGHAPPGNPAQGDSPHDGPLSMTVRPIVLAAGVGKRMKSSLPKVLHRICGRPMIHFVLAAVEEAGLARPIVVVGRGAEAVQAEVGPGAVFVEQGEQKGTAHAVQVGMEALPGDDDILVLYGDVPLLTAGTLQRLVAHHAAARPAISMLTANVTDPAGYGRVIRAPGGAVSRIVEEADAGPAERAITEVNAGTYVFAGALLREGLRHVRPTNAQGEYYLTDVVAWTLARDARVDALAVEDPAEVLGVNSRRDLARAETALRARLLERLMDAGVTVLDPAATYVHAGVAVGEDTIIHPGCSLEGTSRIGRGCVVGPNARIVDSSIGDHVTILASTVVQSSMEEGSRIGPYSHLRPGSRIGRRVEIGNFAEVKNSTIGDETKVHHKSYLGDATIGRRVNIGAGTVTCNLRDRSGKKWPTVIEDEAFIGSDTMLIAPVRIGQGASTGAGAVVTKDVPPGAVVAGVPARLIRTSEVGG